MKILKLLNNTKKGLTLTCHPFVWRWKAFACSITLLLGEPSSYAIFCVASFECRADWSFGSCPPVTRAAWIWKVRHNKVRPSHDTLLIKLWNVIFLKYLTFYWIVHAKQRMFWPFSTWYDNPFDFKANDTPTLRKGWRISKPKFKNL